MNYSSVPDVYAKERSLFGFILHTHERAARTAFYTFLFLVSVDLITLSSQTVSLVAGSLTYFSSISFPGEHLGADLPDILHIGDDQYSAIHNHSE